MSKNILISGKMNSGKTKKIKEIIKDLIKNNESMIILDSKEEYNELFMGTDYEVVKVSLRNPKDSLKYNPFNIAIEEYSKGNIDKSINLIKNIFNSIFVVPENRDPFWDKAANDYVSAIALYLLKTNQELNFKKIIKVLKEEQEFKEYVDQTDVLDSINLLASPTLYAPKETKSGIISVANTILNSSMPYPYLLEMLCGDDKIELKEEKQAIIIVNFDENCGINCFATIILNQLINKLYDLKINYHLILDNYETLGNKEYFENILSTCNARNISSLIAVRDLSVIKNRNNFESVNKC